MNDSISISSSSFSNNSSNNSNSNSLNRSAQFTVGSSSFLLSNNNSIINESLNKINNTNNLSCKRDSSKIFFGYSLANNNLYFESNKKLSLENRRRAKSQILFDGDDLNTMTEQNKQLIEDLYYLKKQLKEKDETILKLNDVRDKLESEIHELSASLFEQAYLMVNTAKAETAQAEKLLKEANGKIDVLQAEVQALKELVVTATPTSSTPNKHLHSYNGTQKAQKSNHVRQSSWNQQSFTKLNLNNYEEHNTLASLTASPSTQHFSNNQNIFTENGSKAEKNHLSISHSTQSFLKQNTKSHKRISSDVQTKSFIDKLFSSSNQNQQQQKLFLEQEKHIKNNSTYCSQNSLDQVDEAEINQIYFKEISEWRAHPDLKPTSCSFMKRVYNEDIVPCLSFNEQSVSINLLNSIELNCVCIEDLKNSTAETLNEKCGLSNISCVCEYKIRFNETDSWIFISRLARNRVISVCDFFTYLRYIKDGLVKCELKDIYWNIIDLRKKMSLSRLGL